MNLRTGARYKRPRVWRPESIYIYILVLDITQDGPGKQNQLPTVFSGLLANVGPGHLPLDSGRRRICRCFCVRSDLEGKFRVRMHILEPCRNNNRKVCQSNGGIIKQHLTPSFRPRVPEPYFPAPSFRNRSGTCLNASGLLLASHWHVQSIV